MTLRDSNVTGDCCKPAHYATLIRELNATIASLRLCSEQHAPRLQTQYPHPSPTHNPNPSSMRKHKLSLFYHFHIVVLVVDSVRCHSCIFPQTLLHIYDICLSLYHSTNSSNKTGPEKRKDKINLIRILQRSQLSYSCGCMCLLTGTILVVITKV